MRRETDQVGGRRMNGKVETFNLLDRNFGGVLAPSSPNGAGRPTVSLPSAAAGASRST
jgi:hypothetical protein